MSSALCQSVSLEPSSIESASIESASIEVHGKREAIGNGSLGRVYLVDNHPSIQKGIASVLDPLGDLVVCGHAASLKEAAKEIEVLAPDVVVVDLLLPDGRGLELLETIRARDLETKAVVYSICDEEIHAERALRAGASGYVMKTSPVSELLEAIRLAARGQVYLSRQMATRIFKGGGGGSKMSFPIEELTGREFEIFRMIGEGRSLEEIQTELEVCRKTVETHRRRAKEKLGLGGIPELRQYALLWTCGQNSGGEEAETAIRSAHNSDTP